MIHGEKVTSKLVPSKTPSRTHSKRYDYTFTDLSVPKLECSSSISMVGKHCSADNDLISPLQWPQAGGFYFSEKDACP